MFEPLTHVERPRENLAPIIRAMCESHWEAFGGSFHRLHFRLNDVCVPAHETAAFCRAVPLLLRGGLTPSFSPSQDHLGVHLWINMQREGILLIADNGQDFVGEPSTDDVIAARSIFTSARCRLVWVPARGTVWRIHIPTAASMARSGPDLRAVR